MTTTTEPPISRGVSGERRQGEVDRSWASPSLPSLMLLALRRSEHPAGHDIPGMFAHEPVKDLTITPRRQRNSMSAWFYPAEKKCCPLWITACIPCSRKGGSEKQRDVYLNRGTQKYRRRAAALFKRGYFKIRFAVAA